MGKVYYVVTDGAEYVFDETVYRRVYLNIKDAFDYRDRWLNDRYGVYRVEIVRELDPE